MHTHLLTLFLSLTLLLLPPAFSTTLTLTYTPLTYPSPHPLALLTISPPTLTAYTPPPPSSSLLRLSFSASPSTTTQNPSTLTLASALHHPGSHILILLSALDNRTLSVSFQPGNAEPLPPHDPATSASPDKAAWPSVRVAYAARPPRPVLNRPVVVSREGVAEEEVVEKTFLQKYWWAILAVGALAMLGGGDK